MGLNNRFNINKTKKMNSKKNKQKAPSIEHRKNQSLNKSLDMNKQVLKKAFGNAADLYIENILIGNQKAFLCYLTSMTDSQVIADKIAIPLSMASQDEFNIQNKIQFESFCQNKLAGTRHEFVENEKDTLDHILNGGVILCLEGFSTGAAISVDNIPRRSISEPTTQTIIRGPKDGFTESVETNISLIRRRIKNPTLRFEKYTIGTETATTVMMVYLEGVTNTGIVDEMRIRLSDIQTIAVIDSGIIEEFIVDKTVTPFPLIYNSERPDTIVAHVLSGKVSIIVDGSPFVLTAPAVLSDFFQVSEDYYQPFMMSTFVRGIRYLSWMISLVFPSIYIALITYHHELIPTTLMISIMSQRENIPFPAVVEALIMEITFEILREAGVRMPRAIGPTVSIVGGLVIGQAAVEAGIISNFMVIVVAITAISSFVAPIYSFAVSARLLRFILIVLAGTTGLYGVVLGLIVLVGHLSSLRSFGVSYLAPFAPLLLKDHKDIIYRSPIWSTKQRPSFLISEKPNRQPHDEPPNPPKEGGLQP